MVLKTFPPTSIEPKESENERSKNTSSHKDISPVISVWSRKASDCVRSVHTSQLLTQQRTNKTQFQQLKGNMNRDGWRKNNVSVNSSIKDSGGNWRNCKNHGDRGGKGRGKNRGYTHGQSYDRQRGGRVDHHQFDKQGSGGGWKRGKTLPSDLCKQGDGETDVEKAVQRISEEELLALRLSYVSPPLEWGKSGEDPGPPEQCLWNSPHRLQEIITMAKEPRLYGDVSSTHRKMKNGSDTAPELEKCKPLDINEKTRWKPKPLKNHDNEEVDSDDAVLKKSLLILNKLSLTKFDKLSDDFIKTGIGRSESCLRGAIELIVNKAQDEPHFAAMYSALCQKLSRSKIDFEDCNNKKGKVFKKMLLEQCQKEFEQDIATKVANASGGIEDEDERAYYADIVKKHYLGHMRFIGELYKGDLISTKIMIHCLPALLEGDVSTLKEFKENRNKSNIRDDVDEEKVECFSKLMTTIGFSLERQCEIRNFGKVNAFQTLSECWNIVEAMAGLKPEKNGPHVSNRIKFMLLDLIELKKNGWVTRRKEEIAKTIDQIHMDAARETNRFLPSNGNYHSGSMGDARRRGSSSEIRILSRKPIVDAEGFVEVNKQNSHWNRSHSVSGNNSDLMVTRDLSSTSISVVKGISERKELARKVKKDETLIRKTKSQYNDTCSVIPNNEQSRNCGIEAINILKEYFVGGDTDDAVLSFQELIRNGVDGSIYRGIEVLERSILMVLEMKKEEVDKFLKISLRCFAERKLDTSSIISGLNSPLEMLNDIVIDAPLAMEHMITIVSEFVRANAIPFDFLLKTSEFFRSNVEAHKFAQKVLENLGGDFNQSPVNLNVLERLAYKE